MPDDSASPFPPDEQNVIARVLCLASIFLRGSLEIGIHTASEPEQYSACQEYALRLSTWLNEQDFTAHFTLSELDALSEAPGTWKRELLDAHPRCSESLGLLLWALSAHQNIPPYDNPFEPPHLEPLLGWPSSAFTDPADEQLASFPQINESWLREVVRLRPQQIILNQRATAECWQWRAQVDELQAANVPPPEDMDYPRLIAIAAEEAHASGGIPRPIKNDFPLFGKPFRELSSDERDEAAAIMTARHLALDWLCGYWTEWDNVAVAD